MKGYFCLSQKFVLNSHPRYLRFDHRETTANDILDFWKTMADSSLALIKVAFEILPVPATRASVECSFSAAGQMVSERRSSISPKVLNDTLFFCAQQRK
jgi:hypothetical protein